MRHPPSELPSRRNVLQACAALPLVSMAAPLRRLRADAIERVEVFALRYPMTGHFKFFTGPHGAKGRASVLVKLTKPLVETRNVSKVLP